MTETPDLDLVSLTADITSAYLGNNKVATSDVAELTGSVHAALQQAASPATSETVETGAGCVDPRFGQAGRDHLP